MKRISRRGKVSKNEERKKGFLKQKGEQNMKSYFRTLRGNSKHKDAIQNVIRCESGSSESREEGIRWDE